MTNPKTVVAVLDDEANLRQALARLLKANDYEVELFESGEDFLASTRGHCPDCLLLDLHMPRMTGFDVLEILSWQHIGVPVVVITGHDEPGNAERVRALGAASYLLKPINKSTLMEAIDAACQSHPQ